MNFLSIAALCVGLWLVINAILHDIFVLLSEHGKKYDRTLLRLLMDGHIMLTCGIIQLISVNGLNTNQPWAYYISITSAISILVYCFMVFPFLKSMVTILLNIGMLVILVINYLKI